MSARSAFSRQYRRIQKAWNFYAAEAGLTGCVPRGHFLSPLPDIAEARVAVAKNVARATDALPGIDLRADAQRDLLLKMADLLPEFDWTETCVPGKRFHFNQGWYGKADSLCLYAMLRLFRPRRVVEVGSGFSSALMLDVDERFLDSNTKFTFIDPDPVRLQSMLAPADQRRVRIIPQAVQAVSKRVFTELEGGDFLFINSSHVSKTGSDVNFLFFEILPQLPPGCLIHFHDIFWPFEYPEEWIADGWAWNEAYLLRAFLSFNNSFEIAFWVPFCTRRWPDIFNKSVPGHPIDTGAAIWLRRGGSPTSQ